MCGLPINDPYPFLSQGFPNLETPTTSLANDAQVLTQKTQNTYRGFQKETFSLLDYTENIGKGVWNGAFDIVQTVIANPLESLTTLAPLALITSALPPLALVLGGIGVYQGLDFFSQAYQKETEGQFSNSGEFIGLALFAILSSGLISELPLFKNYREGLNLVNDLTSRLSDKISEEFRTIKEGIESLRRPPPGSNPALAAEYESRHFSFGGTNEAAHGFPGERSKWFEDYESGLREGRKSAESNSQHNPNVNMATMSNDPILAGAPPPDWVEEIRVKYEDPLWAAIKKDEQIPANVRSAFIDAKKGKTSKLKAADKLYHAQIKEWAKSIRGSILNERKNLGEFVEIMLRHPGVPIERAEQIREGFAQLKDLPYYELLIPRNRLPQDTGTLNFVQNHFINGDMFRRALYTDMGIGSDAILPFVKPVITSQNEYIQFIFIPPSTSHAFFRTYFPGRFRDFIFVNGEFDLNDALPLQKEGYHLVAFQLTDPFFWSDLHDTKHPLPKFFLTGHDISHVADKVSVPEYVFEECFFLDSILKKLPQDPQYKVLIDELRRWFNDMEGFQRHLPKAMYWHCDKIMEVYFTQDPEYLIGVMEKTQKGYGEGDSTHAAALHWFFNRWARQPAFREIHDFPVPELPLDRIESYQNFVGALETEAKNSSNSPQRKEFLSFISGLNADLKNLIRAIRTT